MGPIKLSKASPPSGASGASGAPSGASGAPNGARRSLGFSRVSRASFPVTPEAGGYGI